MKLGHDAFARQTVVRRQVEGECSFCGGKNRRRKVWIYSIIADDSLAGRKNDMRGKFCSSHCCNDYHG